MFSPVIESFWQSQFLAETTVFDSERLSVHINPALEEARRLVLLERAGGKLMVALKPAVAQQIGLLPQAGDLTPESVRLMLDEAGIALHGADHVFHFSDDSLAALLSEPQAAHIRALSAADEKEFAEFQSQASEQDLDDAWVELDHWAVFGAFDAKCKLMCAASMYPWDGAQIADIGVLTLPAFRGQGQAWRVVRAICRHAAQAGYQTQYRCQLDNAASIALARTAGLSLYGNWDVIAQDAEI
ncbi:GNAT family N-acetyltransferase [Roseateles oligotrophus]|uniref:GNAT family N-acetyltransferase n=1 Tax=Roseateles oligotrophus TaxID=1769250 RepID=A0ABT2Y9C8_9BURK|nr:GNAT family N-acetyltransferase [Roseateles oligotrophus]MCV2366907.1 GNAT family N-acetyltransferase [Roseateles oligotrophus]